jgi:hypothetical protein
MENADYFEYVFDSRDASRPYLAGYSSLNWPFYQFDNPLSDVVGIKVLEIHAPFSYYIVNTTNNTFVLNVISDGTSYVITVPVGTYTADSLASKLQALFDAATGHHWTISFDDVSAKYSFSCSPTKTFNFDFGVDSPTGPVSMRLVMGFNQGNTGNSVGLIAPNIPMVSGPDYLYLNSETLGSYMNLWLPNTVVQSLGGLGSEICKFTNKAGYMELISYKDSSPDSFFTTVGINSLQTLDLYLTVGHELLPLDLNGLSFGVKLGIYRRKAASNQQYMGIKRMRAI